MNFEEKEVILFRILSTRHLISIDDSLYLFYQPNLELIHEAERYYADTCYELSFEGWLTNDDIEIVLINLGLWEHAFTSYIKTLNKQVDNLKVEIYKSIFNIKKKESLKKSLISMRKSLQKLYEKRMIFDHVTLEHYLKTLKLQYIIGLSVYDKDDKPMYSRQNFMNEDSYIINCVLSYLSDHKLNHNILREIARTEPWRSYWSIGKEKVFSTVIANLTDEQRALALFSRMYDSAYSHAECPDEDVIDDDDAFDGWMIVQDQTRKQNLAEQGAKDLMSKHKQADEIFIPVDNIEDARKIKSLNSIESQMDLKTRQAAIDRHGKIDAINLPDTRRKLQQQATKEFVEHVKKG